MYEDKGIATHYYCLLLSSNMEQKGRDDEGILGFLAEDIQKELRRGKRLVCSYCKKIGATLGCCNVRCKRIFHFPCGLKAGSLHQFFGEFRSYCINHRPIQKIDDQILKQIGPVDNVVCYICYDKINTSDFVKTLWAPCCKKDAWFHRNCVQQLALSAGYFFKCPLCNNKKDFLKAMQEYGIFVPNQDASWELIPNAFEELLYRHDQCDASKCLCPKGRKHTSHNAKWELALCRTCGSQGIHMACGQLKWANPMWECEECTSILRNSEREKRARLSNRSAVGSCNQSRDSDSDSVLDSDSNSDLDSDTDLSVGTDFPMPPCASVDSSSSSLDSMLDVRLRPGPRSFKLKQKMDTLKKWSDLKAERKDMKNFEKNATVLNLEKANESSSKNDDDEKPSTSKNISQQENKENGSQKNQQSSSKNKEKSQPTQKEADVIVIESDDDDDVKLIALKLKTNDSAPLTQQPTQSDSRDPCVSASKQVPLLNATESSASGSSKSQSVTTIDLSKIDDINLPKKLTTPEPKALCKSEKTNESVSAISEQVVATPKEFTLGEFSSDNGNSVETEVAEKMDTTDTIAVIMNSRDPVMNIKITNVTSLPPEVFESVPDVVCNDDTSRTKALDMPSLNANETLETKEVPPTKRSMYEASNVNDNSKKLKRSLDDSLAETSTNINKTLVASINVGKTSVVSVPARISVARNTNNAQNVGKNNANSTNSTNRRQSSEGTSAGKSSEIRNNNIIAKCTPASTNTTSIPLSNNTRKNNFTQYVPIQIMGQVRNEIVSNLQENGASVNVQQSNESIRATVAPAEIVPVPKDASLILQLPSIGGYYLQRIPTNPNITIAHSVGRTDQASSLYTVPASSVFLPRTDNIAVLNPAQLIVSQSVVNPGGETTPILNNNNQTPVVNHQRTAPRESIPPASTPSGGNKSSNKSYCDGDAGTRPAEFDSTSRKGDGRTSESQRSNKRKSVISNRFVESTQSISQSCSVATRSVFPQVTNNHNTCHQPRLIPRYVNLHDLKFQVCAPNGVQMTLYDTFSVNISLKNPKEGKSRLPGVAAPRAPKESSTLKAPREASCSSDHIDNTSAERQRSDNLFRVSKNENSLIDDKTMCVAHGQDDAKENLDPIRTRMLSHSGMLDNVSLTSNVDDAATTNSRFCGENDSGETRLASSDTNLSVLNRNTTRNANVDTDGVTFVPSNCNQGNLRVDLEGAQQHKEAPCAMRCSAIPVLPAEERPGARLFFKENNRIIPSVDFDLSVVNMNKTVEKVSQAVTVPTSLRTDDDRISNENHTDDSPTLRNGCKHLDGTNVMRPMDNNRNVSSSITRFERSILNKQIDMYESRKFIRCTAFQENHVRHNGRIRARSNGEFGLKVSIDLFKIQNLIDSKPELFKNRMRDADDQRDTCLLPGLDEYTRQQVRYCDIASSGSISSPKNRELQKPSYACNIECTQRDIFPVSANTFLRIRPQKSNQGVKYLDFNKDILDR